MWTLQSTSTHKGPRGHVFSPCLKWKGQSITGCLWRKQKPQRVFVYVCACVHARACVCVCMSVHVLMHALITRIDTCVCVCMCVWFVHVRCTVKIRGQSNAFSASKHHDWNIDCLHTFDKSCCSASHCTEKILPNVQTNMLILNEHVMNELHWFCAWR